MYNLERRFLFTGRILFHSALHIGGGRGELSPSDSPVIRTPDGLPFIPGSSFKGAFRSTVEKLAGSIPGLRSCALQADAGCPGAQGPAQVDFNRQRNTSRWDEQRLLGELEKVLCDTCRLFGSPYLAGRLFCADLYPSTDEELATQIRDGVGIDRDSECAVPRIKFDLEVVESGAGFNLRLQLDNPSDRDLQLTCLGLAEFTSGFAALGGRRTRGLGRCELVDLAVWELDLRDPKVGLSHLARYLVGSAKGAPLNERMKQAPDAGAFIGAQINGLLEGAAHA